MDEGQAGQQLLGSEHRVVRLAVKSELSVESAAAAATVAPWPEVEGEGLGEGQVVRCPGGARSVSFSTSWPAPATWSPLARSVRVTLGERRGGVDPRARGGLSPAARRSSSPRATWRRSRR